MEWINVKDKLPEENETVWIHGDGWTSLGGLVYNEGWLWAVAYDAPSLENGKIQCELYADDEYNVTHWMPLPEPLKQ